MKDLFSTRSDQYARYRPTYPVELFDFLKSQAKGKTRLWDCATGNGQVAGPLSQFFDEVYATDISSSQISNAVQAANIFYSVQPAEKADFPDDYFDMITVSQAIHWFDFDAFYKEVSRTLKPDGVFAAMGYGMFQVVGDEASNREAQFFYHDVTGPYWDPERKFVDAYYRTISFPFNEIPAPAFTIEREWSLDECIGFLSTWSAVKHYIRVNNKNPLKDFEVQIEKSWNKNQKRHIRFPVFMRIGTLSS